MTQQQWNAYMGAIVAGDSATVGYEAGKQYDADVAAYTLQQQNKQPLSATSTAAELQQALSDAVDAQVYTDIDGSKYTIDYMLDARGTSRGTRKVPFTGDVRNLYIDNTAEGNYKLGLARTDVTPESGLTPFLARYFDNTETSPYIGGGGTYNGTPGVRGVTTSDGALMDITLPAEKATAFEYAVHSNIGQIRNRAIGLGAVSSQDTRDFGAGKTEYTTPDAPMWNIDYIDSGEALPEGTLLPVDYKAEKVQKALERKVNRLGIGSRALNTVAGFGAGLGGALVSTADTILDMATPGDNTLLNEAKKSKNVADFFGYDESVAQLGQAKATANVKEAGKNWNKGDYFSAAGDMLQAIGDMSAPENLAYSLGLVTEMAVGFGKFTAVGKAAAGLKAAEATKDATQIAKAAEELKAASTGVNTAINLVAKEAGMESYIAGQTNTALEEKQVNNNGRENTFGDVLETTALITFGAYLDRFATKEALSISSPTKDAIKELGKNLSVEAQDKLWSKVLTNGGVIAAEMGLEAGTEYIQTFSEALAKEYGTDKYGNAVWTDKRGEEALVGAAGGAAGGGQMATMSSVAGAVTGRNDMAAINVPQQNQSATVIQDISKSRPDIAATHEATMNSIKEQSLRPDIDIGPVDLASYTAGALGVNAQLNDIAAEGQVELAEAVTSGKVTPETATGIDREATSFDTMYANLVEQIGSGFKTLEEAPAGTYNFTQDEVVDDVKGLVSESINGSTEAENAFVGLLGFKDRLVQAAGGNTELVKNKLNVIDQKINNLMPIFQAQTTEQIKDILADDKITTATKVAKVIGSSAASVEDIKVLEQSKDLTPEAKTILEVKKQVLKSQDDVAGEKLFGGGKRNSTMQWASLLLSQANNPAAVKDSMEHIYNFYDGQQVKIDTLRAAVAEWDAEKSMPWVTEPINTKTNELYTETEKAGIRSGVGSDNKITINGTKYNVTAADSFANKVEREQEVIGTLVTLGEQLVGGRGTDVSSAQSNIKVPTTDKGVSGEEVVVKGVKEVVEAPTVKTTPTLTQDRFKELTASAFDADGNYNKTRLQSNVNALAEYKGTAVKFTYTPTTKNADGTAKAPYTLNGTITGSKGGSVQITREAKDGKQQIFNVTPQDIISFTAEPVVATSASKNIKEPSAMSIGEVTRELNAIDLIGNERVLSTEEILRAGELRDRLSELEPASPEAQKGTQDAQTTSKGKSTKVEAKEAPAVDIVQEALSLTEQIYVASTQGNTKTNSYKNLVNKLVSIINTVDVLPVTAEVVNDINKALTKDNIRSNSLKKVNTLVNRIVSGSPLLKSHKTTLYELLPLILKEQKTGVGNEVTKSGVNIQADRLKSSNKDNTPIGGSEDAQGDVRESVLKKEYSPLAKYKSYDADDVAEEQRAYEENEAAIKAGKETEVDTATPVKKEAMKDAIIPDNIKEHAAVIASASERSAELTDEIQSLFKDMQTAEGKALNDLLCGIKG